MKRTLVIASAVLAFAVGVFAQEAQAPAPQAPAPQAPQEAKDAKYTNESVARLSFVEGKAFVQRASDLGYEEGALNMPISEGDRIGVAAAARGGGEQRQRGGRQCRQHRGTLFDAVCGRYCSSKAALHSLTDALRMELAPFGIRVVSIQPGGVRSSFGQHAEAAVRIPQDSLYRPVEDRIRARAQAGQQGVMPADEFAVPVVASLLRSPPPRVIRAGTNSLRLPLLKRLLPAATFDAKLSKVLGLDALLPPKT